MNKLKQLTSKQKIGIVVIIGIFVLLEIVIFSPEKPAAESTFASEARAKFNDIASASPELKDISCEGNCDSVVYFNYKTLPADLEFVIKSNAALFSSLKMEKDNGSYVTVFAQYRGNLIYSCNADHGRVSHCQ